MRETKNARFGVRPSRRTTAKRGNGISLTFLSGLTNESRLSRQDRVWGVRRPLRRGLEANLPESKAAQREPTPARGPSALPRRILNNNHLRLTRITSATVVIPPAVYP